MISSAVIPFAPACLMSSIILQVVSLERIPQHQLPAETPRGRSAARNRCSRSTPAAARSPSIRCVPRPEASTASALPSAGRTPPRNDRLPARRPWASPTDGSGEALFRAGRVGAADAGRRARRRPIGSYRCPYGTSSLEASGEACARMIEYVLEREGDIAAFVAEPIRAVPLPSAARASGPRCARPATGTARCLVFDEIPTGLGKTGEMFACQHDGVVPDHAGARQGARRRHPADRRRAGAARARRRRGAGPSATTRTRRTR